jgi:hypothetical protein
MSDLTIQLPLLNERQIEAHARFREVRKALLVRPRRWGATTLAMTVAVDAVTKGRRVGWFDGLPGVGSFDEIAAMLEPVATSVSRPCETPIRRNWVRQGDSVIRTSVRGLFLFYDAASKLAGHARSFDLVIVDNTTHCTSAMQCSMFGDDTRVLVLLSDEDVVPQEFAHLARI